MKTNTIISFTYAIPHIDTWYFNCTGHKEVVIKIDTLSQNVYMLTGQGGNIGIYVGQKITFL